MELMHSRLTFKHDLAWVILFDPRSKKKKTTPGSRAEKIPLLKHNENNHELSFCTCIFQIFQSCIILIYLPEICQYNSNIIMHDKYFIFANSKLIKVFLYYKFPLCQNTIKYQTRIGKICIYHKITIIPRQHQKHYHILVTLF